MPEEDLIELKFRLYDGSDIGPFRYSPASTVAVLKERIVAEWPKGHVQRPVFLMTKIRSLPLKPSGGEDVLFYYATFQHAISCLRMAYNVPLVPFVFAYFADLEGDRERGNFFACVDTLVGVKFWQKQALKWIYLYQYYYLIKILNLEIFYKKVAPKGANDIKLINAGKILENNKTVGQCRVPFGDLPKAVITMHVVVQPSVAKAKTESSCSRWPHVFLIVRSAGLWTW
ncbi:hypothetical protein COLO4_13301 [Corchorus olitorius]|uniref:UBL3-like ubiquitin domain-containing protein n=1 Tax=Corchorus olitorius TaxID=93759 RepID=A0A1R3JXI6_9ROSI|nr:hypothetical protein COLO4_13301 [Corchorus olitorius]